MTDPKRGDSFRQEPATPGISAERKPHPAELLFLWDARLRKRLDRAAKGGICGRRIAHPRAGSQTAHSSSCIPGSAAPTNWGLEPKSGRLG